MQPRLLFWAGILLFFAVLLVWKIGPSTAGTGSQPASVNPELIHPPPGRSFRYAGAGSCSAAACHNGPSSKGVLGSEYALWVSEDRHARAYEVLFNERSVRA